MRRSVLSSACPSMTFAIEPPPSINRLLIVHFAPIADVYKVLN
jgi:hypothetical protein